MCTFCLFLTRFRLFTELLHKPVARVQKNALILHDLLKYSRKGSHEYKSLRTALKMTQCFLNELNIAATEQMFPVSSVQNESSESQFSLYRLIFD